MKNKNRCLQCVRLERRHIELTKENYEIEILEDAYRKVLLETIQKSTSCID